jgi:hypothetical protein
MKRYLFMLLWVLTRTTAFAQTPYQALRSQADAAYEAKNYRASAQFYEESFRLPSVKPTPGAFYNAACCWALAGESTKAFQNLDRATKAGWDDVSQLKEDADLASLRTDKRWVPMLHKVDATIARNEANYNLPLKKELAEIYTADQGIRRKIGPTQKQYGFKSPQMDSLWAEMRRIDDRNLPRVTAMIDQYGWPGNSLVGSSGSSTAFLVIQHSNLATMQKYLPLMRQAAAKGELSKSSLALVEDRILTFQNKPQLYGSQLHTNQETGKTEFLPILDEAHVDERRASMDLGPIAEYAKGFGLEYVPVKAP